MTAIRIEASRRREVLLTAAGASLAAACAGRPRVQSGDWPVERLNASAFSGSGCRGFALGSVTGRDRDAGYFDAVSRTGANTGRIFFPFEIGASGEFRIPPRSLAALDRVLLFASEQRLRLVIACAIQPADEREFWGSPALQAGYVACVGLLARHLKSRGAIVALDILNEPNPVARSGDLREASAVWWTLAQRLVDGIRGSGLSGPIVIQGVAGGSSLGLRHFAPITDTNVVYSVHVYTPHDITHQFVSDRWSRAIPYPAGVEWGLGAWDPELGVTRIDRARLVQELRHAIRFQQRHRVPMLVGEFSCVRWAPDGSSTRYVVDCLEIFSSLGWSWLYHEFRGWPGWDAEMGPERRTSAFRSATAPTYRALLDSLRQAPGARSRSRD
jgi:hypothetical protein